jgi:hypothetical protein
VEWSLEHQNLPLKHNGEQSDDAAGIYVLKVVICPPLPDRSNCLLLKFDHRSPTQLLELTVAGIAP